MLSKFKRGSESDWEDWKKRRSSTNQCSLFFILGTLGKLLGTAKD